MFPHSRYKYVELFRSQVEEVPYGWVSICHTQPDHIYGNDAAMERNVFGFAERKLQWATNLSETNLLLGPHGSYIPEEW